MGRSRMRLGQQFADRCSPTDRTRAAVGIALGLGFGLILPILTQLLVEELAVVLTFEKPGIDTLPAYEQVNRDFAAGMTVFLGLYLLPAGAVTLVGGRGRIGLVSLGAFGFTWWGTAAYVQLHPHGFALFLWAMLFVLVPKVHRWIQAGALDEPDETQCPECGYTAEDTFRVCPDCSTDLTQVTSTEHYDDTVPKW